MRQLSLRLYQLTRALDERFVPYVHRAGLIGRNLDQKQLRSRALVAMAAHMLAGIPDHEAARRVTDCFHDDDIDGFAVETSVKIASSGLAGFLAGTRMRNTGQRYAPVSVTWPCQMAYAQVARTQDSVYGSEGRAPLGDVR
jgi:hypothetical protein